MLVHLLPKLDAEYAVARCPQGVGMVNIVPVRWARNISRCWFLIVFCVQHLAGMPPLIVAMDAVAFETEVAQ